MNELKNILIVDDDSAIRSSLDYLLKRVGFTTQLAANPEAALNYVRKHKYQVVLLDMNYSNNATGEEGLELLQKIKVFAPTAAVILITAWGSIELAVRGMRLGAFDFVTKPWNNDQLLKIISNAVELSKNTESNPGSVNRSALDKEFSFSRIIGSSKSVVGILDNISRIAKTTAPVLITGESGTGKELIAEAIHENSLRKSAPFIKVNLGGISSSLFESEMFGHKKGAFTDAVSDRKGRFEMADGGTIFLDEIGELELLSQVKLLRVLQDQTFEPLGSDQSVSVDMRVICATNQDLHQMVEKGSFREDLLYRINLIHLKVDPLKERKEDIALLSRTFLEEASEKYGAEKKVISEDGIEWLNGQPWPGNVRELKNLIERSVLMIPSNTIGAKEFEQIRASVFKQPEQKEQADTHKSLDEMEKAMILDAIKKHSNLTKVAAVLGIGRATLYRKMEKYNIRHEV